MFLFTFKTTNNLRKSLSNKFFCTRYSKNHLWISFNNTNNNIGTLGLTENGPINKFDDVLYIKFPIIKDENQVDEPLIISLDTISDHHLLNSPINCKLISINQDILDYPNYINSSPMSKGWLCKIKFSNINDFNSLMNENEYDNYYFATIGITNYVSDVVNNEFNKILKIKLPKINDKIRLNQPFLSIWTKEEENIQFKSPLSGIVSKVNNKFHNQQTTTILTNSTTTKTTTTTTKIKPKLPLKSNSFFFNNDQDSWTIELKINEPFQTNHLMTEEEYAHYCENTDYK
ncbi:hypothetical protein ACTFIY_002417 [Dictyostelium cf. discoideum]